MPQPTESSSPRQALAQICCFCGKVTDEPVKVGEVHTAAGVGSDIYACPICTPRPLQAGEAP